jgi:hypothetical protein
VGQQRERNVTLPSVPLPYLVLVQPGLALALLEALLDLPAFAGEERQLIGCRPGGTVGQVES